MLVASRGEATFYPMARVPRNGPSVYTQRDVDSIARCHKNGAMNERDYLRLKRQFLDDYHKKLAALEIIWQESSNGKKPPREQSDLTGQSAAERGQSAAAVIDFVQHWDREKPFSTRDVEDWIRREKGSPANRTTITHKLRRLANEGHVDILQSGRGKRASTYQVARKPQDDRGNMPASSEAIERLKELLTPLLPTEESKLAFRDSVLQEQYGVRRLAELNERQISELAERFDGGVAVAQSKEESDELSHVSSATT